MKGKDTKGQRQNHLGSLLGLEWGPGGNNTVGADNLLIRRKKLQLSVEETHSALII